MINGKLLRREFRVAFSRRAQPLWFRILKWTLAFGLVVFLWGTPLFWWVMLGGLVLSLTVHFTWRWKTKGWTRPWAGWDDVDAAGRD